MGRESEVTVVRPPVPGDLQSGTPVARPGHDQRAEAVQDRPVPLLPGPPRRAGTERRQPQPGPYRRDGPREHPLHGGAHPVPGEPVPDTAPRPGTQHRRRELAGGGQRLQRDTHARQPQPLGEGVPERRERTGQQQHLAGPRRGEQIVGHPADQRPRHPHHPQQLADAARAAVQPPPPRSLQLRPRIHRQRVEPQPRIRHQRFESPVGHQRHLVPGPRQRPPESGVGGHVAPRSRRHDGHSHAGRYAACAGRYDRVTATRSGARKDSRPSIGTSADSAGRTPGRRRAAARRATAASVRAREAPGHR
ncbi:hypothetical protein SUDANB105_00345 [Streptomyces sp. enrichment culture]